MNRQECIYKIIGLFICYFVLLYINYMAWFNISNIPEFILTILITWASCVMVGVGSSELLRLFRKYIREG